MLRLFKQRFWQAPRAHGEIIEDRTVSFLELFYDLVFVVVIARATHTLAEDITWRATGEFAVVFGLIWLAWLNGTAYHDLHSREDGRSRTWIFVQMLLLALLASFTAEAAHEDGAEFAIVYTVLLLVLTWLWYVVRRQDDPRYASLTAQYLTGMVVSVAVMAVSIFLSDAARTLVWAAFVVLWLVLVTIVERSAARGPEDIGLDVTESLIERFGLFVIIVLGEVVVGVVTGLSEVERNTESIATGMIGLMIGFGIWWTYFDYVGRRRPRPDVQASQWSLSHLPVTMGIAASGAALVSLIEHAGDDRPPADASWLLVGSVALSLLALIVTMRTLRDYDRLLNVYRPLSGSIIVAVVVLPGLGWWRPQPWILATAVVVILSAVWFVAVDRWLRMANPEEIQPNAA